MKSKLPLFSLILLCLNGFGQQFITSNTTWSGNVFLSQKVIVQPGVTLSILPGTNVSVGYTDVDGNGVGDVKIIVNGKLKIWANACNKVRFGPYTNTTNLKYWSGITINSATLNDSIQGINILNADTALKVRTAAYITSAFIEDFGTIGINYIPIVPNTILKLNNNIIKNGNTAILADSIGSKLKLDWCSIDSCINGLMLFNGDLNMSSSRVLNSSRLGLAIQDGNASIYNCLFRKNYAFGIINSSGDIQMQRCLLDSNSLGGYCMAGNGSNSISYSTIMNNSGAQFEITDYKLNLSPIGKISNASESAPAITVNYCNIKGDTSSTFTDNAGLFQLGNSNIPYDCMSFCSLGTGNAYCNYSGQWRVHDSPGYYYQIFGRLNKISYNYQVTCNCSYNQVRLQVMDYNLSNPFPAIGDLQVASTGASNTPVSVQGIAEIICNPTYIRKKFIRATTPLTYTNYGADVDNHVAYYKFGGDLIYNSISGLTSSFFDFKYNNYNSLSVSSLFYDASNTSSIDYSAYTIFPITNSGLAIGENLLQGNNFPDAYLFTSSGTDTACGTLAGYNLIVPALAGASYKWYYNGNLFQNTSTNTYQIPVAGQWSCEIVTSTCTMHTGIRNIVIQNAPVVSVSGNTNVCQGQSTTLTASGAFNYLWSNGSTNQSITLIPNANTNVTVIGIANGCQATASANIIVNALPSASINPSPSAILCTGSQIQLTAIGGISYLWSNGATGSTINVDAAGVFSVTVTNANNCTATSAPTTVVTVPGINATISPSSATICKGQSATLTAGGGNSYTWSNGATTNSITVAPTQSTTYTVTATGNSNCTATASAVVTVNSLTNPTFNTFGPYCAGASAPVLPTNSNNGINGTWSPSSINTNNAGTSNYIFMPSTGQCASSVTIPITVNATTTPSFNNYGPYCEGAIAPSLPIISNNGVIGTWNPASISTANQGTSTYTFTPNAGSCNVTISINITVNTNISPTFNSYGPYCVGASAPVLPTSSNNGVNGTWNPATINTSNTGTTNYTFTPNAGQCANSFTFAVTVNSPIVPSFNSFGPYCTGASATALPTTSNNGITGTWSPTNINANNAGTSNYTFTPSSGQCANSITIPITVNATTTPSFNNYGPYCVGAIAPSLPISSNNGVLGTWNPASISTANQGTSTYTFTPNAGACNVTISINITVNTNISPTFNSYGPFCVGASAPVLPTSSNNGVTGTWNPATINTSNTGTNNYTFTPNAGQCSNTYTFAIAIGNNVAPNFNLFGPYCIGATPTSLPTTSNNGIVGTWNPSVINTNSTGIQNYIFTPNAGQCGSADTIPLEILAYPNAPSITVNGNTQLCPGEVTELSSSSPTGNLWSIGATSQSIQVDTSGNYSVSIANGDCSVSSNLVNITMLPGVTLLNNPVDQLMVQGTDAIFTTSTNNPNTLFQWQMDQGAGFTDIINGGQFSGANNDTLYVYSVTTTNNNQLYRCICTASLCADTTNTALLSIDFTTYTQNNSIQSLISIMPNPAKEFITLYTNVEMDNTTYLMTNLLGEIVQVGAISGKKNDISIKQLTSGIYIIYLNNNHNKVNLRAKVIKE